MATVFDTLAFSRKLTDPGMDQRQSEAVAGAVHDAVRGSVATKQDLDIAVERLRSELSVVKWMCATIVASALALVVKAFF